MAFLVTDDKLLNPNGTQAQGASDANSSSPLTNSGGGFVSGASSGVSSAGVGPGGSGGWTNIQAYLGANKDNTGSASYLNSQVGNQFSKEQSNLSQSAQDAKTQAQSTVDANHLGQDQASKMIQDASQHYNPTQTDSQYDSAVGDIKNRLNTNYSGPTSYQYGYEAPTQQYGTGLGTDQGFQGVMSSLYNEAAGGQIGQGAKALQQQLDTNNDSLNQARQNLLSQYSSLNSSRDQTLADTNAALAQAQNQYTTDQGDLKNYLTSSQTSDKKALDTAASDWNAKYGWNNGQMNDATTRAQAQLKQILDLSKTNPYLGGDGYSDNSVYGNYTLNANPGLTSYQMVNNSAPIKDISLSDYMKHSSADATNVPGEDSKRNEFNTIADILGQGSPITANANLAPVTADYQKFINDLLGGAQSNVAKFEYDADRDNANKAMDYFRTNAGSLASTFSDADKNYLDQARGLEKATIDPLQKIRPGGSVGDVFYKLPGT